MVVGQKAEGLGFKLGLLVCKAFGVNSVHFSLCCNACNIALKARFLFSACSSPNGGEAKNIGDFQGWTWGPDLDVCREVVVVVHV